MPSMEQSLGQLARRIPGATGLFDDYQLDFCCAGNRSRAPPPKAWALTPSRWWMR